MSTFARKFRSFLSRLKPDPYAGMGTRERFETIYRSNDWRDNESVSGPGSTNAQTLEVISIVEAVINEHQVGSVLDLPCGDFGWMRRVDLQGASYVGGDIVHDIIQKNVESYGSIPNVDFQVLDLIESELPKADLIIVRDCLVHLSEEQIHLALENMQRAGIDLILTTTFTEHKTNYDIQTGDWRPINLQHPPYNWPTPLAIFNERCTENNGKYTDKSLALWAVDQIPRT